MMKKIATILIPILLITIVIVLLGSYGNPLEFFAHEELIPDTNIQSIDLNESILLGDKDYIITSVDMGDNYTTVKFNHGIISGMELYQNGKKLEFITASHSSYAGSAIAFESTESKDELEIRIFKVKRNEDIVLTYPLVFDGNTAIVEDTIDGVDGSIKIIIKDETIHLEFFGSINDIIKAEVDGFIKKGGTHFLLRNGEDIGVLGDVSYFEYPPDEIKIYSTIIELDDEQLIIPVN